jgi:TRAP-type C4-dicarboxylate transport system substrate-binding protein
MKQLLKLGTLGLALTAVSVATSFAADTVRVASFTSPKASTVKSVMMPWMKDVAGDTGGAVNFKGFWGGALGRNPRKQIDMVLGGTTDVAFIVPSYTLTRFPETSIFSLPYMFRNGVESSTAAWRMYEKGLLSGFDKFHPVAIYASDNNTLHVAKPIKALADVKGMKFRAAGPMESRIVKMLGGTPVGMPPTTVTESVSRGVINGALLSWTGARSFRVFQVTKGHLEEPLGTLALVIGMNKKSYDSKPKKVRASMDRHGGLKMSVRGGQAFDNASKGFSGKMRKDKSRTFLSFSGADWEKRKKFFSVLHSDWIKNTPNGKAKYAALVGILKDIRSGK